MSTSDPPTSVGAALAQARAAGVERLDAQLLLGRILEQPRTWILAHAEARLDPQQARRYSAGLARRGAGEPLAYLLGSKEFHGLTLQVDARVLVPRPDTEVLVHWALEILRRGTGTGHASAPAVVDLGTGSGAIALAVKHAHPAAQVVATDLSAQALEVAAGNAQRLQLAVQFHAGAWWQAVAGSRFDLALSNPPYIALSDPHLAALAHEPLGALSPGEDGLAALRDLVAGADRHLRPGAWLLLEHGYDQADAVRELFARYGYGGVTTRHDLAGRPRCTGAQTTPESRGQR